MNKKLAISLIIFIILAVVLIIAVAMQPSRQSLLENMPINDEHKVMLGGETFHVELAKTPAQRAQGLSGRNPLDQGTGMFFIFDEPAVHGFWMKDMKFSLDIIWIMDGRVVDIWKDAPPPITEDIPRYRPDVPAEYVLEVNAGFVERSGLKIGDEVEIDF